MPSERLMKFSQYIHDLSCAHGARCSVSGRGAVNTYGAPGNEATVKAVTAMFDAEFAFDEPKSVQAVHDLALGSGAACAVYLRGLQGKLGGFKPGQYYQAIADMLPAFKHYKPGNYYAAFAAAAEEEMTFEDATFAAPDDLDLAGAMAAAERHAEQRNAAIERTRQSEKAFRERCRSLFLPR